MFVLGLTLGSGVVALAHDLIFRLWGSYTSPPGRECFWHNGRPIPGTCYRPFSTATHAWVLAGLAAAVLLAAWVCPSPAPSPRRTAPQSEPSRGAKAG